MFDIEGDNFDVYFVSIFDIDGDVFVSIFDIDIGCCTLFVVVGIGDTIVVVSLINNFLYHHYYLVKY